VGAAGKSDRHHGADHHSVAVSVHTIVSWDFAMTIMPMWHSTIFGPYFVVGAIFSGIAALLIAMVMIRKYFHLEHYLLPIHFDNLAKMLFTMSLLWFYFTFTEYLVTWYGNEAAEMPVFWSKVSGPYAPMFWLMVACNFIIPFPDPVHQEAADDPVIFFASCCVVVGMWIERFLIIVPTLIHPYLPYNYGHYWPSVTGNVHRRRHGGLLHPAVFPVREIQPDDFDSGNMKRVCRWRPSMRATCPTRDLPGTSPGDVHPAH
jgi:Ni/Fe-hydrogenase subunit HybB-like protein